ncbi:hypothetical protein [Amycolatopsis sp. SID8362]|uniref:hypothetical protein n=1 Tax=Amycolatopsis sp. SID8362 TaxID=2690346 RepID=UPI00137146E7|nr:hypothetical protein [Amycolatopsis sp. SID8362]NBH07227.1 hypothetical protein [Amycolatopsis sp. SID8362]NED43923.1 hypothetical protein [Amycolatopsis sp. SID8362]
MPPFVSTPVPAYRPRPGRRKSALPAEAGPAVKTLKKWLRGFVGETSLEAVAAAASYSVSAVSGALGGTELPRLRLVRSIAAGVGAPAHEAHRVWWAAALEEFTKHNPGLPGDPLAELALDLRRAMLRHDLGKTDVLRRMARLCEADGDVTKAMSRATLCRLLTGTTLPRTDQMTVFLRALSLRDSEVEQLTGRYEELSAARRKALR